MIGAQRAQPKAGNVRLQLKKACHGRSTNHPGFMQPHRPGFPAGADYPVRFQCLRRAKP
jgi:hypothetical protein